MIIATPTIFEVEQPVVIAPLTEKTLHEEVSEAHCNCVVYLREERGIAIRGDAKDIEPNIPFSQAQVGDVLLVKYKSGETHAGQIIKWSGKGAFIHSANLTPCEVTDEEVDFSRVKVIGAYRPIENSLAMREF